MNRSTKEFEFIVVYENLIMVRAVFFFSGFYSFAVKLFILIYSLFSRRGNKKKIIV